MEYSGKVLVPGGRKGEEREVGRGEEREVGRGEEREMGRGGKGEEREVGRGGKGEEREVGRERRERCREKEEGESTGVRDVAKRWARFLKNIQAIHRTCTHTHTHTHTCFLVWDCSMEFFTSNWM